MNDVSMGKPEQDLLPWILQWVAHVNALALTMQADQAGHWLGPAAANAWQQAPVHHRVRAIRAWLGWSRAILPAADTLAHRLLLLGAELLANVLMIRALFSRVLELRRCIEGERLIWFENCVGAKVFEDLRHRAVSVVALPLLPRDADRADWIGDGWRRLLADGVWSDPCLAKLSGLALPLRAAQVPPVVADGASVAFLEVLPDLMPELSCACG